MNKLTIALTVAASATAFTGCIDDKYDLSDIETTARVNVNSLTVPVNIDEITLTSIIDIEEGDKIQIVNGQYALLENGTFNSGAINVTPFTVNAPAINPSTTEVNIPTLPAGITLDKNYEIEAEMAPMSTFEYHYTGITDDIVAIDQLGISWNFDYIVNIASYGADLPAGTKFKNVVIQLPKGLTVATSAGTYDSKTGEVKIAEVNNLQNGITLSISASAINIATSGIKFDGNKHSIDISGQTGFKALSLMLPQGTTSEQIPSKIVIWSQPILSAFEVKTFTGKVKYTINDLNIAPVTLNDLPDFLNQGGTDVSIANPQIYIKLTNPFAQYGIQGNAGLSLTATRDNGEAPVVCSIDNGTFPLYAKANNSYCLSPVKPESYFKNENVDYTGSDHVPYSSLSNILAGNGLPNQIEININNPEIPVQQVNNFRLGSYPQIEGSYTLYAPLALKEGSQIVYSDVENGWNDEDIDKITISELNVTASVTTDLPFNVKLTGYPIDINGNKINNVEIDGADIQANANGQQVKIHITGTVTHLDGISFEAKATAPQNSQALSPSQGITLKNIRATVSGYYEKEL
ncbi:MAG: hypothetical protein NC343_03535 [Muribaculum sp.]|nr:hypothetical protein [Muribaculaceae bacterium]MCM1080800.1 hypothetical protein [Muribaculum sp.]